MTRVLLVAAGAVALSAAPARAQEASLLAAPAPTTNVGSEPAVAPATTTALPTTDAASVAVRRPASSTREMMAPARGHNFDEGTKLMIVGGAAILTGIVVGGNAGHAISIAGAVVGLIGLYEYLQ